MASPEQRELFKILKKAGFELKKQSGGHIQFECPSTGRKITVPARMNNSRCGHSSNVKKSVIRQIEENNKILKEKE